MVHPTWEIHGREGRDDQGEAGQRERHVGGGEAVGGEGECRDGCCSGGDSGGAECDEERDAG